MQTRLLSTIAAALATITFTTASFAQYKPVGDDGIAASPKLRQTLSEKPSSVKVSSAMACKKCVETPATALSHQAKGAENLTGTKQTSYSHGCSSCETKLTTAGEGKAKHQVALHTCAMASPKSSNCCAAK